MNYTSVAHCGHEHQEWIKAMDFYKDDLQLLQKRLMEIAGKNNGHDTMAEVEHFQNQFIVQRNNSGGGCPGTCWQDGSNP
jgi:hypothetical protein